MRMVRFALGTQFGTLCFASAVLVVVQMIRSAAEQVMRRWNNFTRAHLDSADYLLGFPINQW